MTVYHPPGSHEGFPDREPDYRSPGDHIRDISTLLPDIITKFADIIDLIPARDAAHRHSIEMSYIPEFYPDTILPEYTRRRKRSYTLLDIKVTSTIDKPTFDEEEEDFPPTTSIEIVDTNGTISISRDPSITNGTTRDTLITGGGYFKIDRTPDDEISTLLLGLCQRSNDEPMSDRDVLKRLEASDLIDSLQASAAHVSHDYDIKTPRNRQFVATYNQVANFLQLDTFFVKYETKDYENMSVTIETGADSEESTGFGLTFRNYDKEGERFTPGYADYAHLHKILDEELQWLYNYQLM